MNVTRMETGDFRFSQTPTTEHDENPNDNRYFCQSRYAWSFFDVFARIEKKNRWTKTFVPRAISKGVPLIKKEPTYFYAARTGTATVVQQILYSKRPYNNIIMYAVIIDACAFF